MRIENRKYEFLLRKTRRAMRGVVLLLLVWSIIACAGRKAPETAPDAGEATVEATEDPFAGALLPDQVLDRWGIEIVAIRPSAGGSIIDFRYRIVDADKATFLVDRTIDAYITHQESGLTATVPNTAKIGPLRQTQKYGKPPEGKIFFILFSNPNKVIDAGDEVAITIGEFQVKDLVVQTGG